MVFTLTPHIHKLSFKSKTIFTQKTYLSLLFGHTVPSKQCRPRSDTSNVAPDHGLHCLTVIQHLQDTSTDSKMELFNFFKISWGAVTVSEYLE